MDMRFETAVNQVAALSPGTEEKLRVIAFLTGEGEMPFREIQEELEGRVNKSTLYNYLNDLVKRDILEKRVEKGEGRRPVSYYSIKGFMLYLSPRCVLSLLKGKNEVIGPGIMDSREEARVIDGRGESSPFHPSVLVKDMLDAGIRVEDALEVATYIKENLYKGITTREIADIAVKKLAQKDRELGEKFHWFLRGEILVKTREGEFEEWDRKRLLQEMENLWKGIEKKSGEMAVLAKNSERCIKRQNVNGPIEEDYVRDMLRMNLS